MREKADTKNSSLYVVNTEKTFYVIFKARVYRLRSRFVVGDILHILSQDGKEMEEKMSTWVGSTAFFSLELWNEHKFQAIRNVVGCTRMDCFITDCWLESQSLSAITLPGHVQSEV